MSVMQALQLLLDVYGRIPKPLTVEWLTEFDGAMAEVRGATAPSRPARTPTFAPAGDKIEVHRAEGGFLIVYETGREGVYREQVCPEIHAGVLAEDLTAWLARGLWVRCPGLPGGLGCITGEGIVRPQLLGVELSYPPACEDCLDCLAPDPHNEEEEGS